MLALTYVGACLPYLHAANVRGVSCVRRCQRVRQALHPSSTGRGSKASQPPQQPLSRITKSSEQQHDGVLVVRTFTQLLLHVWGCGELCCICQHLRPPPAAPPHQFVLPSTSCTAATRCRGYLCSTRCYAYLLAVGLCPCGGRRCW